MSAAWWAEPAAGDIVWCHFADDIHPRPKPKPALILTVFDDDAPRCVVRVAYGTSQRTTSLHRGEFAVLRARNLAAYEAAGLSYDTKFDLGKAIDLPFTTDWFSVPPAAPHAGYRSSARSIPPWCAPCRRHLEPPQAEPRYKARPAAARSKSGASLPTRRLAGPMPPRRPDPCEPCRVART